MKEKDNQKFGINIRSEVGELEGVILHTPGPEVENMTPQNAERALYSDILNLSVATNEYAQFKGVLDKITRTFQVRDLLKDILLNEKVKQNLILKICQNEGSLKILKYLNSQPAEEITKLLLEGALLKKDNLSAFLSKERYALRPLHNFFFTRDSSITIRDKVLIGKMASQVRERESIIMEAIFDYHPFFNTKTISHSKEKNDDKKITVEGGDVLVAREDLLLIGIGSRTTTEGVDFIIEYYKEKKEKMNIIVQELPLKPESFIHLDMVFTFLSNDYCMLYEPVILKPNRLQTVNISIENGEVISIKEEKNLLEALKKYKIDLKPLFCGGTKDSWIQEREQWHSGANFFAVGPGKVIGYARNTYTIEEMSNNGFDVIKASDVINNNVDLSKHKQYVITIEGSELPRGGGGARCMTMPVRRKNI